MVLLKLILLFPAFPVARKRRELLLLVIDPAILQAAIHNCGRILVLRIDVSCGPSISYAAHISGVNHVVRLEVLGPVSVAVWLRDAVFGSQT